MAPVFGTRFARFVFFDTRLTSFGFSFEPSSREQQSIPPLIKRWYHGNGAVQTVRRCRYANEGKRNEPMIRPIMKNEFFLQQPSETATSADLPIAYDLLDTLAAHTHECVGMAANMIGQRKRIIVFVDDGAARAMINPEIAEAKTPYETDEGCLSLVGRRSAKRFRTVRVRYLDLSFKEHVETFSGFTAQIIQHEIDHCNGVVI